MAQYRDAMTSWAQYVKRTMGADDQKTAATKAKVDQSAISRWLHSGAPGKAENVARFARSYGRPVSEAFVAAGFMTEIEARQRPAALPDYSTISNDELLRVIAERIAAAEEYAEASRTTGRKPGESGPKE